MKLCRIQFEISVIARSAAINHLATLRKSATTANRQLGLLTDDDTIAENLTIEDFAGNDLVDENPRTGEKFIAVIQLFVNVVSSAYSFLEDNVDEAALAEQLLRLDLGDTKLSNQEQSLILALVALRKFVAWVAGGDATTFDTHDIEETVVARVLRDSDRMRFVDGAKENLQLLEDALSTAILEVGDQLR